MTSSRQALDQVIAQIKEPMYITEYLTACGYDNRQEVSLAPTRTIRISTLQQVSSGPATGATAFSCQTSFDIFDLCVWLEGRPSSGPAG